MSPAKSRWTAWSPRRRRGGSPTATGPIETVIDEDLLQDFNTKYVGALRCSRAVIPFMKTAGWGRIINISGGNARNAIGRPARPRSRQGEGRGPPGADPQLSLRRARQPEERFEAHPA